MKPHSFVQAFVYFFIIIRDYTMRHLSLVATEAAAARRRGLCRQWNVCPPSPLPPRLSADII